MRNSFKLLQTPRNLFTLWASAGAGKSYLFGAILTLWLRWVETAFDRPDDPPIAVVATSRAQHREDLRRNITKFLPGDQVFIMESMVDMDVEDMESEFFWQAASSEEAKQIERSHWKSLSVLDAKIDEGRHGDLEWLRWVEERTALLWEKILWLRGDILHGFLQNKLRVLVLTSDKLRKTLAAASSWFRQRPLGLLIQDEFQN